MEISLRVFTDGDMELFAVWVNKPYILKRYKQPNEIRCGTEAKK